MIITYTARDSFLYKVYDDIIFKMKTCIQKEKFSNVQQSSFFDYFYVSSWDSTSTITLCAEIQYWLDYMKKLNTV